MGFPKEYLDLVLVPSGLLIMFTYHIFLLYRYLHRPHTTFMGYENNDKRAWVESIMEQREEHSMISRALTVTNSNSNAAMYLATISLTLCSLIGAWIANSSNNLFQSEIIYGDTRQSTISIKYISLLTCFLLAFSCFVQSARHLVNASYLISNPSNKVPVSSVEIAVIRGGELWSLGLRALYFALNLLLWFFGPIPMFMSSIVMVTILHYLDANSKELNQYGSAGSLTVNKSTSQQHV
ncbi:hypothetical protein F2P56_009683 [Juglans regia]|uniref:Uncharacterized protein LOC108981828 n=2 Tax=Juglans regia TaxID=51240 RepID=A0A2I4DN98_JUGRE|nr:uncharacterized protein LOC108981828 [Juglans regia]KAF5473038.1 hypothetical protein F2P56_009683 [Juglans regia]